MPFPLANALATFQNMMNEVLCESLGQAVVVYINHILTYSSSQEEHEILVAKVLQLLHDERLAISPQKTVFHVREVEFLR